MNHVELELSQRNHVLVTAGTWGIDLYDVDDVVAAAAADVDVAGAVVVREQKCAGLLALTCN